MLVRKSTLTPWAGEKIPVVSTDASVVRLDGSSEPITVDPYTYEVSLPRGIENTWSDEALLVYDLARVVFETPPEGKYPVGNPRYELREGVVYRVYDYEDIPAAPSPDIVSSRQFHMQLVISGLKGQVEEWVAQQDELVQIAFRHSSTFVKTEPMLQAGFEALGFTEDQRDAFFEAASKL